MKLLKRFAYRVLILVTLLFGYMKITNQNINDIGLSALSWVKKVKGSSVNLDALNKEESPLVDHQVWTTLLAKHVTPEGNVNYQGFLADQLSFDQYLASLSATPPGNNWSEAEKIAYWINVYNAFTVKLIIDHYPLKSIKDIGDGLPMIGSPWDIKFFKIGAVDFDLNTVEHEILRKHFVEPRIHFAINCASFSCPRLRNEAFEARLLDQQLEEQTHLFINNPDKNIITHSETKISKIFSWFASDFQKKGSIESLLKKHHAAFKEANDLEYMDYGWNLNESKNE